MKKRADIYFLIYLATLMSLFAIEAELGDYQEHQKDILFQVANERIEDLVEVVPDYGNSLEILSPDEGEIYQLNMEISGDYVQGSLKGKARFTLLDSTLNINPIEVPLEELGGIGDGKKYYSILTDLSIFGDHDTSRFKIGLELTGDLEITDETFNHWVASYGSEEVAEVIKHNIESKGSFRITKYLDALVVPSDGGQIPIPEFGISLADESGLKTITDIPWKTKIFVQGVSSPDEYTMNIIKGNKLITDEKYDGHQITLTGKTNVKSVIIFSVTRTEFGTETLTKSIPIDVFPAAWESKSLPDEIYLGDQVYFDGRVKGIESAETGLKISSSLIAGGSKTTSAADFLGPYSSPGTVTIEAMYGEYVISGLKQTITVKPPPPPKIENLGLYKGTPNQFYCRVTVYGKDTKLAPVKLFPKSGMAGFTLINTKAMEGRTEYEFAFGINKPSAGNVTPVEFMVLDSGGKKSEVKWSLNYKEVG